MSSKQKRMITADKRIQKLITMGFSFPKRVAFNPETHHLNYYFNDFEDYRARAKDVRKQARLILKTKGPFKMILASYPDPGSSKPHLTVNVLVDDKITETTSHAAPYLTAKEQEVYNDYMYSGNQNFWTDRNRVREITKNGFTTVNDYLYAGYSDAHNRAMNDRALVRRFLTEK